jgi:hypothetical protein
MNGHCNEATPRRNSFWASMTRIAKMINRGIEYFPSSVRHNFNAAIRRAEVLQLDQPIFAYYYSLEGRRE